MSKRERERENNDSYNLWQLQWTNKRDKENWRGEKKKKRDNIRKKEEFPIVSQTKGDGEEEEGKKEERK